MFCGRRRNLGVIDDAGDGRPKPTPPKQKKAKMNPYSTVGLNKFSDLLADLDARRARILANARPEEASSIEVRFTYSGSDDFVPIIVRRLDNYSEWKSAKLLASDGKNEIVEEGATLKASAAEGSAVVANGEMQAASSPEMRKVKKSLSWWLREVEEWSRWNLWFLVLVLILCSLLMLGKVFAICCTTIWWYSLPYMAREGNGEKRFTKKEQIRRRKTEKSMVVKS